MELKSLEAWFITGSRHLYGEQALRQVAENSGRVVKELNGSSRLPIRVVFKPVVTTPESILQLCREANAAPNCIGLICWMHTFSPAKMWIAGLGALQKPTAHGDREFGFICTRMGKPRKVIVGHWQDAEAQDRLAAWMRAAAGLREMRNLKVARLGDNMRQVAVTEGDKVEAQIRFGTEVNGYGVGELAKRISEVADAGIDRLVEQYDQRYVMAAELRPGGPRREAMRYAARTELSLRAFLDGGQFKAFTDTFEDLVGLEQLPGLAVQRLMADGYGYGAEGDWKTAALGRIMTVMAAGLQGGTSFMEDYTCHLDPQGPKVLGAHMLEICPSLAAGKPSCEIHPLGIGGKSDPVRLVFTAPAGPAINVAMIDMGNRFRLLVNEVDAVEPEQPLPKLPVARAFWTPRPDLKTAAAAWIYAGGPHHTVFSQALSSEPIEDFAEMVEVECLRIDGQTQISEIKNQLRWNQAFYGAGAV